MVMDGNNTIKSKRADLDISFRYLPRTTGNADKGPSSLNRVFAARPSRCSKKHHETSSTTKGSTFLTIAAYRRYATFGCGDTSVAVTRTVTAESERGAAGDAAVTGAAAAVNGTVTAESERGAAVTGGGVGSAGFAISTGGGVGSAACSLDIEAMRRPRRVAIRRNCPAINLRRDGYGCAYGPPQTRMGPPEAKTLNRGPSALLHNPTGLGPPNTPASPLCWPRQLISGVTSSPSGAFRAQISRKGPKPNETRLDYTL